MADLGLLGDAAKLVGGGVAGWIGRVITEKNKARKTRQRLYRELAANLYWVHTAFVEHVSELLERNGLPDIFNQSEERFRQRLANIRMSYYDHAAKDMDTIHALPDYDALLKAFDALKRVSALDPWNAKLIDLIDEARERGHEVVALCRAGRLDKRELLRHTSSEERKVIEPLFQPETEWRRNLRATTERPRLPRG